MSMHRNILNDASERDRERGDDCCWFTVILDGYHRTGSIMYYLTSNRLKYFAQSSDSMTSIDTMADQQFDSC